MAEHKLSKGKGLIDGLCNLGEALNYHVRREIPVQNEHPSSNPAVDVAWFKDKDQRYPIMIFEVESRAGNTISNNPVKVFGQNTTKFEKPLFFFQIIAEGETNSSSIDALLNLFGSHNYRIYRIGCDDGSDLVKDIFRQHRRISSDLDYALVYETLNQADWQNIVEVIVVLDEAFNIGLSPERKLVDYIFLARNYREIRECLTSLINGDRLGDWFSIRSIQNYFAENWGPLLLCAWCIGWHSKQENIIFWEQNLLTWQNEWCGYLPMFSAEIELSSEYEDFVLSVGGPFIACVLGLTRFRCENISNEFLKILVDVLRRIKHGYFGLQLSAWICHIAARIGNSTAYEAAQSYLHNVGSISLDKILSPPSSYSLDENDHEDFLSNHIDESVDLHEFSNMAYQIYGQKEYDLTYIMSAALLDPDFCFEWSPLILASIWSER
ncbi:MAG: hypothetical protein CME32_32705 [Gimesia sp.]|nr:hypothetical protein [Gimesia sp.]